MPECEDQSALTSEHRMLVPFVGEFNAVVKMYLEPGAEPHESRGIMHNELDMGGRFLKQEYTGAPMPMKPTEEFHGKGYWGYNNTRQLWEGFWIDTASTMMQTETGSHDLDSNTWTMLGQITAGDGSGYRKRSVVTLHDDNRHDMNMFFTGPDGAERIGMSISYTRKK